MVSCISLLVTKLMVTLHALFGRPLYAVALDVKIPVTRMSLCSRVPDGA